MKKVVVTGGAGFVGRHLLKSLFHKDIFMIIIDNLSNSELPDFVLKESRNKFSKEHFEGPNFSFYQIDIRDKDSLDRIFCVNNRIDTCIHLAAQISVTESIRNPKKTTDVNVNGTRNILRTCVKYNVKNFVFASSSAVYGNPVRLPLCENETPNPISPYGESKLRAEKLVSSCPKAIKRAVSLRFFNIYGKGQTPEYAGVITKFAKRLSEGSPPVIYGNGKQTRDFVSVQDVVRAILLAARIERCEVRHKPRSMVDVFNIGTGKPTSITELANMMTELFGSRSSSISLKHQKPIYAPAIEGDILESYADTTKAEQSLGFKYHDALASGLKLLYV